MYFSEEQVSISFQRLASRKRAEGKKTKTHLERTSILMCFLAFDARCKNTNMTRLDMNPDNLDGRGNREAVAIEFSKLVLLDFKPRRLRQVLELGKVSGDGKDPAVRFSSNFLTVPLKKATEQSDEFFYPKRPASSPMIRLGQAATGMKWGMSYHQDWPFSLPKLMSEVKDSTPFTDLAIFVMRDTKLAGADYLEALTSAIYGRFSEKLANFWTERIKKERVFVRHILPNPFSPSHQPFARLSFSPPTRGYDALSKTELIEHLVHLEGILEANQIEFEPLTGRSNP